MKKQIADELSIGEVTVKMHRSSKPQQQHVTVERQIRSEAKLASSKDCERKLTRYLTIVQKIVNAVSTKKTNTIATTLDNLRDLRSMSVCATAADAERGRKAPPDICAKRKVPTSSGCLKSLLKSSPQAPNN
jgi:hypothetical protein